MEKPPSLSGNGVVAFVELTHQIIAGLAFDLLGAAEEQNGRGAVSLFVDFVDCAVKYGHCVYLG